MHCIVTGGAGYVGSVTTALLLEAGHEVTVVDDLSRGHRAAVPAGARLVVARVGDRGRVARLLAERPAKALLHFAALTYVGESVEQPARYLQGNVVESLALFETALRAGVARIVFSSSCAVYGTPERLPLTEDHPHAPVSPYGATKAMCEQALRWLSAGSAATVVALRYFNACGAYGDLGEDHRPETHLLPIVLQVALGQRSHVAVFGDDYPTPDGTCIRDYVHVADLADAHVRALELGAPGFHAFNLGTGKGHSVAEVVRTVAAVTGRPIPTRTAPRRPGDPPALVAAAERARAVLGWQPRHTALGDIVASAWPWHNRHPHGYS